MRNPLHLAASLEEAPGTSIGTSIGSPGVDLPQGRSKEGGDSPDALGVLTGHGGRVIVQWRHGMAIVS